MDYQKAKGKYEETSIATASNNEIIIWMIQKALQNLEKAKVALQIRDLPEQNRLLNQVQQLVFELMIYVNKQTKEGKNLLALYDYINRRLIEANMEKSLSKVNEVERYFIELLEAWKEVKKKGTKKSL
ncbi:flagellar export chaperone FliS [Bacillus sp. FJAT-52991]|uniref:Flagellar export chaperone FliS n=1 Tax=Bacillus kandeliae TaxID=3129297 RepID=A0ABZ2N559_9BACI